jgi:filamentous hemagglutinin family protein
MSLYRKIDSRAPARGGWQTALRTGVAGMALVAAQTAHANPDGGRVVAGQAVINGQGTGRMRIDQTSDRVVINWDDFSIDLGEGVEFRQPNARSVALNRVTGPEISRIMGDLTANGQIYIINGNGIVFGKDARVDVAGLIATTADIGNDAFMMGGTLRFGTPGRAGAKVTNHGTITVRDAGIAAFVAPQVANDGIITAHMGRIAFGGAQAFTLDLHGDNLIRFQVGDAVTKLDDKAALVGVDGVVDARGGSVLITASAARDLVNQSVRVGTPQAANMQVGPDGKVSLVAAKVAITAPGEVQVGRNVAMDLSSATNAVSTGGSKGKGGKASDTESAIGWVGSLDGAAGAPGQPMAASGSGGTLTISAARTILDGTINLDGSKAGGTAHITGSDFLSFGSILSASGVDAGGKIQLDAGGFSLAGRITVNAALGKGGSVDIRTTRRAIDTGDAFIDASGLHGGSIRYVSDDQIISSGRFRASGSHGFGGAIDVSAPRLDLFSAQFYAQGGIRGGRVRLGGEFQGGKGLSADELPNALKLVATDAVTIDVSAIGMRGNAGEIVVWSDERTTFLGNAIARGGLVGGVGGQIEISGKETLVYRGNVETARGGQRGGTLLLDPKNIIIAEGGNAPSQYALVLQAFASSLPAAAGPVTGLAADDAFGSAVSLDGNRLAVGVPNDDGADNSGVNTGAVYLFTFADLDFGAPVLAGIIGKGYTGGQNVSVDALSGSDRFGLSVSLSDTRLAVGAPFTSGPSAAGGAPNSGAVYLFTFDNLAFANGALQGVLGSGFSGPASFNVTNLEGLDAFGSGVSLSGNRLAVGALEDDGFNNSAFNTGAVYLFSFADNLFSSPNLEGIVGSGYAGGKNLSVTLDDEDLFGASVALDGRNLVVGAWGDDGAGNSVDGAGAVHNFTFVDTDFNGGLQRGTIGLGYTGADDLDVGVLDPGDRFGFSVSLFGTGLAVGAPLDDGNENAFDDSGTVYLFTFSDNLSSPTLQARLGRGYPFSPDIEVDPLSEADGFGQSVSLFGNLLAVGASGDDGRSNAVSDAGAVYLYSFADTQFGGGRLAGTLGAGYLPVGGLSLTGKGLEGQDAFGTAVSLDGNRLAVGAPQDDGVENGLFDAGAVYLFTFGDARFSAPSLQAIIGAGYSGGKNLSVASLQGNDRFGSSVSLRGLRLAVGAPGDDGLGDTATDAGAVYVFGFDDRGFGNGALSGFVNFEFFAPGAVNGAGAAFGASVALQDTTIAIGATGDAGADQMAPVNGAGAVHIVDIGEPGFFSPLLLATIGRGYAGGNNIDVVDLGENDAFGSAVSLDGLRLAVGAPGDDGFGDDFFNTGAVYLFTFAGSDYSGGVNALTMGAGQAFEPSGLGLGSFDEDFFGSAVALKGLQLVVGARGDDGANDEVANSGAVYLFNFVDQAFGGANQVNVIGANYGGFTGFSLKLATDDGFGSAVAFDGDRLVVGAPGDDGRDVTAGGAGAAHFFTFAGADFVGIRLIDTLGFGYTGTRNFSVPGLSNAGSISGQQFGAAVALDGLRLAVGAPGNPGAAGGGFDLGAVYLFSFADTGFSAPVLQATLGQGYVGGKNIAVPLSFGTKFGSALALDGNRLAVGTPGDPGNGDPPGGFFGSVFLFTFSDSLFSGGALVGKVGFGATGPQSIDVPGIEDFDRFGSAVALRGNALVVGAPGDDGVSGSITDSGAVYLFTFADASFNGGVQRGLISFGATAGPNDIDLQSIEFGDQFGSAVALSPDGTTLFVGANGDDGSGNLTAEAGAVYQFDFGSATFESGAVTATFGQGYTGFNDLDITSLADSHRFGSAVAFDGNRLVIGAPGDGGNDGSVLSSGAVYLFTRPSTQFTISGRIGLAYGGPGDLPLGALAGFDSFGSSLALDQGRLVVGAPGDGGVNNDEPDIGAVYLFGLGDDFFVPPSLIGTIGQGYGPGTNVALPQLGFSASLGAAVSLRDTRLAIGAPGSGSSAGAGFDRGAVYLFTFADTQFAAPVLASIIGQGFVGGSNFDLGTLEDGDRFGQGVSLDGLRLAVGAPGDDGAANDLQDAGAVYLFTFGSTTFESPELVGRMGRGYVGAGSVDVPDLEVNGAFGFSVALQGQQLAVGSPGADFDVGQGGSFGAVFLYTFTSSTFAGGERAGTIGLGYNTLAGDFNLGALSLNDRFGSSVSLSGLALAVGAPGDDGALGSATNSGAVYLFSFADTSFAGVTKRSTLGADYDDGETVGNFSVEGLAAGDGFGSSVSLEGQLLAVGLPGDSDPLDLRPGTGAVGLFSYAAPDFSALGFSDLIGSGYVGFEGGLSVIGLDQQDAFGSSVAIDQGRLVVGATGDDGRLGSFDDYGAVYLFRYGGNFTGLTQAGLIGSGYANGPTPSLAATGLGLSEQFGTSVSLQGLRLAVGTPFDRGGQGDTFEYGAVFLFSFADLAFGTPVLESIIGSRYTGGKNLSVANLDVDDRFGVSVHLSADGLLSVGADGDDGFDNDGFDRGAVYLFDFADGLFSGGNLQGIIGSGYAGPGNFDIALDNQDLFGSAVASQGQNLAIGAPGDDGSGNPGTADQSGAVHLFLLSPGSVSQLGTIGINYTGPGNLNFAPIGFEDFFGQSLSIRDGQLVVGAPNDQGAGDVGGSGSAIGAVYAFTFSQGTPFADLAHVSTLGLGYTGPNDLDVTNLGIADRFGSGVSLDGNRLAVGARQDGGALNDRTATGAVYLFSFADAALSAPVQEAIIGFGYGGGKNLSVGIEDLDLFGQSVSLDGNRLAVGAPGDSGAGNSIPGSGAVHLFTFADASFGGARLTTTLGAGYRPVAGLDLIGPPAAAIGLDNDDRLGASVSLDGLRLAIGATGDDGADNGQSFAGAVYLFSFADLEFGGVNLEAVVGNGYSGGKNLSVTGLDALDDFGAAVSLSDNRLAVGAPSDDGSGDVLANSGAVYLFSFADPLFSGGALEARIGAGYSGGKNLDISAILDTNDNFGSSVSLTGGALAVGALGDAGSGNVGVGRGAVHLFTFDDPDFNGGLLRATIGSGYSGGNNLDVALDDLDRFGISVSLDGLGLAVGADGDDGAGNAFGEAGAAYLFTFDGPGFGFGALRGRIGAGYDGSSDVDTLATPFTSVAGGFFGTSLSLDGDQLAVGAPLFVSSTDSPTNSGAVYLISFGSPGYGSGSIDEILARGAYNFGNNDTLDVPLSAFDLFGTSVSLDGNRLVVGAQGDDGFANGAPGSGTVYLFTFDSPFFGNMRFRGNIGSGYSRGPAVPVGGLDLGDGLGSAVSLNGNRLAVGVPGDDGAGNALADSGAVYLFTFATADFASPVLEAVLGSGYTGGKNLGVSGLTAGAAFGASVALDGTRLAVGAPGDAGELGAVSSAGAAYLFTFSDAQFGGGALAAIIGSGYSGGNNLALALETQDRFGAAISLRDTQLAVGAPGDDGFANSALNTGAVFLFTFADSAFATPILRGAIGRDYGGGGNFNLALLEDNDDFGTSLSLDGLRLAVGAPGDDGAAGGIASAGAVHLFTFADSQFATPALARTIGAGYAGANAVAALETGDRFGTAVALSGTTLVVGAPGDRGADNSEPGVGAAYLFSVTGATLGDDPVLNGRIGRGYAGLADIDLASLGLADLFASALALDGERLVIGAPGDDGPDDLVGNSGAVYFFRTTGGVATVPSLGFGDDPGADVTISASALADILSGGTAVTLQANNDITVNADILVDNPAGDGGALTFQAGRSILINAGITTDNGALSLLANVGTSAGVVDAFRDPGPAVITFGAGGFVDAGTGQVDIRLLDGAGQTHFDRGAITLGTITAGIINVITPEGANGFDDEVILLGGVTLTASDAGDAITVVSRLFTNTAGAGAFNLTGGGRFRVYSADYDAITRGGLVGNNLYNRSFADSVTQTGNLFIFARQPILTFTADDQSRTYGQAAPAYTFQVSGLVNGDSAAYAYSGAPRLFDEASGGAGLDAIRFDPDTLASDVGYGFAFVDGTLTTLRALLTVTADDVSREYGLANPGFTASFSGFVGGDDASVISGLEFSTIADLLSDAGTYAITPFGAFADNYDFDFVPGTLTITKALLTVTADNAAREYGLTNPAFTGTITGFRNGDDASVISGLTYGSVATIASDVGSYAITGSGASATNYDFSYVPGTLTITRALLTVTADNATREYGLADPVFTGTISGFRNGDDASVVAGLTYASSALLNSGVGTYSITGSGGTATNYDFSYVPGTLTITRALLTVTADNATREYGLANPAFTGSISGLRAGDTASVVSGLVYGTVATTGSAVGTYAITASGGTAANYDFAYVPGTLTITRALLTVTADNATREYGLANPAFTGTVTGFRNGDDASVISGLTYGSVATIASDVGSYAITGSGASATNYDFSYVPGTLTITRALLTVTAADATRDYGLADPAFTGTISGFRNGDDAGVVSGLTYTSNALLNSGVGTYSITGSGGTATNYDFSYVPGTLTITRALLTVTADNATREYGLANPAFTGSIAGLRAGDTASVVSGLTYGTVATTGSAVGTYAITASGGTAANYDFAYVPGTLTITKALLTVTANNATREYGLANPVLTGTISGLRAGDGASVITGLVYGTAATAASNAGTYAITASGGTATNYDFAYVPGTLTITRALLTVTADGKAREYGLANPALTSTISGLRNGDTASVVSGLVLATSATQGSAVGSYAITASGGSALNYDFAYVPGTLVINPATLTVTIDDRTRQYGAPNPAFTASLSGFRNGDDDAVVSGLKLSTSANIRSNAGSYVITGSGASAANYRFDYIPGTLTITKAMLQVRVNNASREYGLANPGFSAMFTGFRNGDNASVVSGLTFGTAATIGSDVGSYAITASGASALNYDFSYIPGRLTISQAQLLITADSKSMTQGSSLPVLTVSYSGLRNGDTADVVTGLVLRSSGGVDAAPGQYIINASRGSARNYQITYRPGVLTVLPVVTPPAQDPPGTGDTPPPPAPPTPNPRPPVTVTLPPVTLPIAGGNPPPTATPPAQSGGSIAAPPPVPPLPGTVTLPQSPQDSTPLQVLQGLSAPLPVLLSPELQPADDAAGSSPAQGDGQRGGCEYISLCNGTAASLWTWQPAQ